MKYPQLVSMPSAVSDWLEEQLEARGIDAVVYTRYVLSLLYRDPVDIICPDQDLHFTHPNKEARRAGGGGGRKRFCHGSAPSEYAARWRHADDADRLKRSAAVECLKSASDQKCGIESLVDELWAKLQAIQHSEAHEADVDADTQPIKIPAAAKKLSERDSAKRYYAAFPALSRQDAGGGASPKLIHLIPKWFGSPKRRIVGGGGGGKKHDHHRLHAACKPEPEMKARSVGKQRYGNYYARNANNSAPAHAGGAKESKRNAGGNNNNNKGRSTTVAQAMATHTPDDMYDDLPFDIRDLLESPTPPSSMHVELMMNMANMRDAGGSKAFIPSGTNIISSIWSTGNAVAVDAEDDDDEPQLDREFSNIAIDRTLWASQAPPSPPTKHFDFDDAIAEQVEWSFKMERWSDPPPPPLVDSHVSKSLLKLNHHREGSCFTEVKPRVGAKRKSFEASPRAVVVTPPERESAGAAKEDLLHSASSHFKPINEQAVEVKRHNYADGTTFAIDGRMDQVRFERSASGTMYLEAKRYYEYKKLDDDGLVLKFNVNQNDKACQTEVMAVEGDGDAGIDYELLLYENQWQRGTTAPVVVMEEECERPDSMMAELFGKESKCEKCHVASWDSSPRSTDAADIWNGEICMTCLHVGAESASSFHLTPLDERKQLREDIEEDGEQLLSDLSSLQKNYMEQEEEAADDDVDEEEEEDEDDDGKEELSSVAEETCDIGALIYSACGSRIKHRGSDAAGGTTAAGGMPIHSASFSFATRLQQDCLLKMATIPTLRSVTL